MKKKYCQAGGPLSTKPGSYTKPIAVSDRGSHNLVNDLLYKLIDPVAGDDGFIPEMKRRIRDTWNGENAQWNDSHAPETSPIVDNAFWAKYLGLPYNEANLVESAYKPTKAKTTNGQYYTLPRKYVDVDKLLTTYGDKPVGYSKAGEYFRHNPAVNGKIMDPIQNMTVGRGKDGNGDYVSIYDKYDLASNPLEGVIGKPFEVYDRYYFSKDKKGKYTLKQQGGPVTSAIIEQGEVAKDLNGQLVHVNSDAPSHDDSVLITPTGPTNVAPGKGGVWADDLASILSDSQTQINRGDRRDSPPDAQIRIKPKEAASMAKELGLKLNLTTSVSPSKLFWKLGEARDKQAKKYTLDKPVAVPTDKAFAEAQRINRIQLEQLPTDEQLYDHLFDMQETKKLGKLANYL